MTTLGRPVPPARPLSRSGRPTDDRCGRRRATAAPLLVALPDPLERAGALAYAVDAAGRESRDLRLVRVGEPAGPSSTMLDDARRRVDRLTGGAVHVDVVAAPGPVVDVLLACGGDADRIVVQHRSLARWRRVVAPSVAAALVARAVCPVVSVPEYWSSWLPDRPRIGVWWPAGSDGRPAMRRARAAAAVLASAEVKVLAGPVVVGPEHLGSGGRAQRPLLDDRPRPALGEPVPELPWRLTDRESLREATRSLELLVVGGRRPPDGPSPRYPRRPGTVAPYRQALALVDEALCPVEVLV